MILRLAAGIIVWALLDWALRVAFSRLPEIARPRVILFERFARAVLLLIAVFVLGDYLGYAPHDLWTGISTLFALLGIGLIAFWSVLSSVVCGIILLLSQPFSLGDEVEIFEPSSGDKPGTKGTVVELTNLYLVLDPGGEAAARIFIPHNVVLQRAIRVVRRAR